MIQQKTMIIERVAEALPENERTKEILEQRRQAEEARQQKLEQVSQILSSTKPFTATALNLSCERLSC